LPEDLGQALLVGRLWLEKPIAGPAIVVVRGGHAIDVSDTVATVSDLLDSADPTLVADSIQGQNLGPIEPIIKNSLEQPPKAPYLLAPCDLQAIKACGVTFTRSLIERVIEEQAKGNAVKANRIRQEIEDLIGSDLLKVRPGSSEAATLKAELKKRGAWSQYLEVGIGPDAEVFSKAQVLSSVGFGAQVGILPASKWNNPEPEIVLAVDSSGRIRGATLGNDVNLRDIEGRSALLLGKAKDNNASSAIGPFIRLLDDNFTLDKVRSANISLTIEGADDGFVLEDQSLMSEICRDPLELVDQVYGHHHQYPDGFMLFLGTMFSPIKVRDKKEAGFTHHIGDRVTISSPLLGALINTVGRCDRVPPWTFGLRDLISHLKKGSQA
jgi:fumarylacetoacetate (FAA) hydrolase family protein